MTSIQLCPGLDGSRNQVNRSCHWLWRDSAAQGGLESLRLLCLHHYSWNLDIQLSSLTNLVESGGLQSLFSHSTNLLKNASATDLPAARTAFQNAASLYMAGSQDIRARSSEVNWLINWDSEKNRDEEKFRLTLIDLTNSLTAPVALDDSHTVNAGKFFSPTNTLRSWMPAWGKEGFILGSLPDPTFGGIVGGLTKTKVEDALGNLIAPLLRVPGVTLTSVCAFPTNAFLRLGKQFLNAGF